MFKKKDKEEVKETPVVQHFNPLSDPLCAGCGKPVNTVTVRNEKGVYHGPACFNKVN